jgi:prophage antirepressor-like protein
VTEIQVFDNGEFQLRVHPRGETFWVEGPDLARALGFREAHDLVRALPEKYKGSETVRTPGGDQEVWLVSEPGVYKAIGQRQIARIRNDAVRVQVERFQDWMYEEVLPTLRRTGRYEVAQRSRQILTPRFDEPKTYTWEIAATLIEQRYGMPMTALRMRELLRSGGVLRQTGDPKSEYRSRWFWHTGSAWEIHAFAIPQVAQKLYDVQRDLQEAGFMQARFEIEGMPSWPEPIETSPPTRRSLHP